ncbi:cyclic nucleotide-binding domain-containing protein [Roseospira marina]|uniref:Cyclic nucleotide-binding domain-containing protein n=2 Tax=Roseospira marina TaxID=140057 RepID=A0A5M6IA91_9PROT|nr:cation:proton antiporter [Roseospira marina]KAA5605180.1 cyclic nucleotide-binding domain-containing protein [Roseospira marina]MBB5087834.1 CPA1 family monovalent cation:H+ antiporter [Roseospira marina]
MDIIVLTTIIAALFLLIAVAEPLAGRVRLPYSVILAGLGILVGAGAVFFLRTTLTDALNPVAEAILDLPIRSNVFLYVFLPTLLFQVTLGVNVRRMMDDWVPILVLAVVAVVVATLSVGSALAWASALPLTACLLVGSIVSTTDPSAVVGIFRSIAAPRRLARIIEGESLLNDAAAIALFGLFMGFVMLGVPNPTLTDGLTRFPVLIAGGAVTGWVAARIAVWVMALFSRYALAQISVSVALPYLAYIGAEQSVGASGVIAVVVAGLTLNVAGPGRLGPTAWGNLREVWDLLAHWSGALIFILAALLIPRLLEEIRLDDVVLIAVVTGAAIAARALILFGLLPLMSAARISPMIEPPYRVAILWGGLRGAVTLALALAVTESRLVPDEIKRLVGILATGFTLFTLIVQGTTLRVVIGWLGLDKLSPLDQALSGQVIAVALQTVREDVATMTDTYQLTHDIVRTEAKRFGDHLDEAVQAAEANAEILDRDRVTLGLLALAGAERDTLFALMRDRMIPARLADDLLSHADHLIEATRANGSAGYERAAKAGLGYGRAFRTAVFLHNRLWLSAPLARMTAARFESLLSQRMLLRDLDRFIDRRIRRIHGRGVADHLHGLLAKREEAVTTAIEGLRLQYPGYAETLERSIIRRTALRLEEREYAAMREDGLIEAELHTALMQDLETRRQAVEERPRLDVVMQREDLIRRFPLFADLDDTIRKRLSRTLVTRHADPGEVLIRKDSAAHSVYFIASGAVEVETAGQTWRLGRGEMFGQMAILTHKPRRADVRAIAPSTLLVLDDTRFRRLLRRSPTLQAAVRESGEKRGVDPALLLADTADLSEDRPPGR